MPQPWDLLKSAFFGFLSYLYGLLLLIGGVFGLVLRGVRSILNQAGRLVGRPPRTYLDRSLSPIVKDNTIVVPPEYKLDRVWFAGANGDDCWIEVVQDGVVIYRHDRRGTHKFKPPVGAGPFKVVNIPGENPRRVTHVDV